MIHYDDLIKAEKMGYFSDYETLLFARAKGKIKGVTGVLPLTFTAKGGTAGDWVIYGNDENGTENEFDGTYIHAVPSGSGSSATLVYVSNTRTGTIPCSANTQYAIKVFDNTSRFMVCCSENAPAENISLDLLYRAVGDEREIIVTTNATANYLYVYVGNENEEPPMVIKKGSTAPDHYIPYQQGVGEQRVDGYYVPLTISQQGQPDKTVDIYIGDSPLTEGETVSKTSTGVDIELFEGENTVSTTLYNKPKIKIEYE